MLEVQSLRADYGQGEVLSDVSFTVPRGGFHALIGANGAGKSTTMRAISGLLRPVRGRIVFDGRDISTLSADRIVKLGLALVPEGRKVFAPLTVRENLEMGAFQLLFPKNRGGFSDNLAFVLDLFPRLEERLQQAAGTLSGGEQQMLAIGRALMGSPRMLLLDEPSMGLAPLVVTQIFDTLRRLRELGLTIFVCEQNTSVTLRRADHGYVLEGGRIALSDGAQALIANDRVREAYLGV
ncbi:MAG: ABC transporter ATP-binding protein [Burkholderiales bacterium]|nr:ABC transporter ATP-binding protein [Burkholderiales bacterium]